MILLALHSSQFPTFKQAEKRPLQSVPPIEEVKWSGDSCFSHKKKTLVNTS